MDYSFREGNLNFKIMKLLLYISFVITLFCSCDNSLNSEITELKSKNEKLQNTLDSLNNNLEHSLVIYKEDLKYHFMTIINGPDTIKRNSKLELFTALGMIKFPEQISLKWSIDKDYKELNNVHSTQYVEIRNLEPGINTIKGKCDIFFNDDNFGDFLWEKQVYVK